MLPNKIMYWSGQFGSDEEQGNFAIIDKNYENPIIKDASQYLVAVERVEISLHEVPFFRRDVVDVGEDGVSVVANGIVVATMRMTTTTSAMAFFEEFADVLIALILRVPGVAPLNFDCAMEYGGFLKIEWDQWDHVGFRFGKRVARIIGKKSIGHDNTLGPNVLHVYRTVGPRLDIGDEMQRIVVSSNIPIVSDRFGQTRQNVLADFAVENSVSAAFDPDLETFDRVQPVINPRQRMLYFPSLRRFKNISAAVPLKRFRIEALYQDFDGKLHDIPLGIGGIFSVKLAFYSIR